MSGRVVVKVKRKQPQSDAARSAAAVAITAVQPRNADGQPERLQQQQQEQQLLSVAVTNTSAGKPNPTAVAASGGIASQPRTTPLSPAECLATDVVSHIHAMLNVEEFAAASQVSRQWLIAAKSRSAWPSLRFDLQRRIDLVSRIFTCGEPDPRFALCCELHQEKDRPVVIMSSGDPDFCEPELQLHRMTSSETWRNARTVLLRVGDEHGGGGLEDQKDDEGDGKGNVPAADDPRRRVAPDLSLLSKFRDLTSLSLTLPYGEFSLCRCTNDIMWSLEIFALGEEHLGFDETKLLSLDVTAVVFCPESGERLFIPAGLPRLSRFVNLRVLAMEYFLQADLKELAQLLKLEYLLLNDLTRCSGAALLRVLRYLSVVGSLRTISLSHETAHGFQPDEDGPTRIDLQTIERLSQRWEDIQLEPDEPELPLPSGVSTIGPAQLHRIRFGEMTPEMEARLKVLLPEVHIAKVQREEG
jgi:hypothetical protein